VNLHERGLLGKPNYLYSLCITSRERFIYLENHTLLRLGELTREGLIGKTKLPLLPVHHFKGEVHLIAIHIS